MTFDQEIFNRLNNLTRGVKLLLILKNAFDGGTYEQRVELLDLPYKHGFYSPNGGWSLYKIDDFIDCWKISVHYPRERKFFRRVELSRIVDFKLL